MILTIAGYIIIGLLVNAINTTETNRTLATTNLTSHNITTTVPPSRNITASQTVAHPLGTREHPFDDSPWIAIALTGMGLFIFLLTKKGRGLAGKYDSQPRKQLKNPYEDLNMSQLTNIAERVTSNIRIVVGVYGVLLSFMVTTNLQIAFSSWIFALWTGWTLAIMIRAGNFASSIIDIEVIKSEELAAHKVFAAREFSKHAIYLLVIAIAFTPVFFLTPHDESVKKWEHWGIQYSLIAEALAIGGSWAAFYFLIFARKEFSIGQIPMAAYSLGILALGLNAAFFVNASPLDIVTAQAFGSGVFEIPAIFEWGMFAAVFLGLGAFIQLGSILYDALVRKAKSKSGMITP